MKAVGWAAFAQACGVEVGKSLGLAKFESSSRKIGLCGGEICVLNKTGFDKAALGLELTFVLAYYLFQVIPLASELCLSQFRQKN